MITFDDFAKLEIKIGKVVAAEKIPNADKLLKLTFEFGTDPSAGHSTLRDEPSGSDSKSSGQGQRTIVSGVAEFYTPEQLVGKLIPVLVNLEPRKFRGVESQGMILAADDNGKPVILEPKKEVPPGSKVR